MSSIRTIAPVAITAYQCVTAAGDGVEALVQALMANRSCLRPIELFPLPFTTLVGEVKGPLPDVGESAQAYRCRNARLALKALDTCDFRREVEQTIARYGADRVGVVLGTSTSGIYDSESAYLQLVEHGELPADFNFVKRHTAQATAEFLRIELGLRGPCYAISTACSSSAKALAAAQRLIVAGACDAVLAAGVDTLCRLTLRGFASLELISPDFCAPMDRDRRGINIGEGAGMLLLERTRAEYRERPHLLAVGETSDAHHMSAPHPEGAGAAAAMRQALDRAGIAATAVDYVKLHATGTQQNDLAEARAMAQIFPRGVPCSGVKGVIGHTLGAAGAVEAVVGLLAIGHGFLPGTCGLRVPDRDAPSGLVADPETGVSLSYVLCNAFGFGGSNASVLLGASP